MLLFTLHSAKNILLINFCDIILISGVSLDILTKILPNIFKAMISVDFESIWSGLH